MTSTFLILFLFLLPFFVASPVAAADSPSLRIGRVSAVEGAIALRQVGGEWTDSGINDPITAGMAVRTAPGGRAALRVGPETIALAGGSEADLARLDSSGMEIVLHHGRIGVRLSKLDPAYSIEVDIPKGGVWLSTPGDYDIAAGDEHAPARVAVLDGRAHFAGKGLDTVIAGGSAEVLSGGDPVEKRIEEASADGFSIWWRAAGGPADPQALRYVSAGMTGYEALDGNGSWETDPVYGAVWFPNAASDVWAPYRNGHWRWIASWGWTWIDDMPWAFAPSHYGRWAKIRETDPLDPSDPGPVRWGWVPGTLVADPIYAPALVAFLGTRGVGLSYPDAAGPAIAWFPLAPGELYWPCYTSDIAAIRGINRAAVADVATIEPGPEGGAPAAVVNGAYRNRRFARAVPRAVFTGGRPVAASLLALPDRRLENAPLLAGSPEIGPPAARPVQAAPVTAARNRAVIAAAALKAPGAAHVVIRDAAQHGSPPVAHATVLVRRRFARGSIRLAVRSHWANLRQRRSQVIAAVSHTRPRLRFVTARRSPIR